MIDERALDDGAALLARGLPLEALQRIALLEAPRALALRGVAMAQLGDLEQARKLLRRASKALSRTDALSEARCVAAEAEIAVADRDLASPSTRLEVACETLRAHGDHRNAAYAELVLARRHLLLGELDEVEARLGGLAFVQVPPTVAAVAHLVAAEVAMRRLRAADASRAMNVAAYAARESGIGALCTEVDRARERLGGVAARLVEEGTARAVSLAEIEQLLGENRLIVDTCRRRLCRDSRQISLLHKPVLLDLARELAIAGPDGVPRDALIGAVFGARKPNESHRARLRVDVGRLRKAITGLAKPKATREGYALVPTDGSPIAVLLPPIDAPHATLTALLSDGQAWSTAALALATGRSKRTVQRALAELKDDGRVSAIGRGPARRWLSPPLTTIATAMLLPEMTGAG